jgi:flagellar biosynthesis protein
MTSDEHSPPGPGPGRRSAIALTYEGVSAPKVSATGDGELAEAIIREAQAQGVFVTKDPVLAAALAQLRLDEEIPDELFTAVAIVLAWAYWLQGLEPPRGEF